MKRAAQMNTALATCRAEYFRLQQELHRNGLDATAIQVTCDSLSLYKDAGFFSSRTNEAKSPHSGKMEFSTKPKPEEVINEAYHIGS